MNVTSPTPQDDYDDQSETSMGDMVVIVIDGPGDTTRRPRRPNTPYFPPPSKDVEESKAKDENSPPAA